MSAGHPAALAWRRGECVEIAANAPIACAAFPPDSWKSATVELGTGALLLVYTDGLADALGPSHTAGCAVVRKLVEHGPRDVVGLVAAVSAAVEAALGGKGAVDDVSMVAVGI